MPFPPSERKALLGATCWKNSPQARAAIDAAIALARSREAQAPSMNRHRP